MCSGSSTQPRLGGPLDLNYFEPQFCKYWEVHISVDGFIQEIGLVCEVGAMQLPCHEMMNKAAAATAAAAAAAEAAAAAAAAAWS